MQQYSSNNSKYAPEAVCILIVLLEQIGLGILGPTSDYLFSSSMLLEQLLLEHLLLEHNFGPKSHRSLQSVPLHEHLPQTESEQNIAKVSPIYFYLFIYLYWIFLFVNY